MKILCPICGKRMPRKKMVLLLGLRIRDRVPRVCQECFDRPDEEYREECEDVHEMVSNCFP